MENKLIAHITVFNDAAKAELVGNWSREVVGWFQDEVSAIGAVCERALLNSAILPDLRQLPKLDVTCEYRRMRSGKEPMKFKRAITTREADNTRRVVMLPGARAKEWLALRA